MLIARCDPQLPAVQRDADWKDAADVIERTCGRPEQRQNNDRSKCDRGKCTGRQHQFVGDLALFGFRHLVNATAGNAAAHGMQAMRRLAFGSIRLSACLNKFVGLVMSLRRRDIGSHRCGSQTRKTS